MRRSTRTRAVGYVLTCSTVSAREPQNRVGESSGGTARTKVTVTLNSRPWGHRGYYHRRVSHPRLQRVRSSRAASSCGKEQLPRHMGAMARTYWQPAAAITHVHTWVGGEGPGVVQHPLSPPGDAADGSHPIHERWVLTASTSRYERRGGCPHPDHGADE
jgi:hypothetical protein